MCELKLVRVYKKQTGRWLEIFDSIEGNYRLQRLYELRVLYAANAHEPPYGFFSEFSKYYVVLQRLISRNELFPCCNLMKGSLLCKLYRV